MSETERLRDGGLLIAKIHQTAGRVFGRMLKAHGIDEINPAQGRILFALWEGDEVPINELAKRTKLGKSTLTTMLDRLEGAGYVERIASAVDRRQILIRRTSRDERFRQAFVDVSRAMTAQFYAGLAAAEVDAFEKTLRHILANLEQAEDESG